MKRLSAFLLKTDRIVPENDNPTAPVSASSSACESDGTSDSGALRGVSLRPCNFRLLARWLVRSVPSSPRGCHRAGRLRAHQRRLFLPESIPADLLEESIPSSPRPLPARWHSPVRVRFPASRSA